MCLKCSFVFCVLLLLEHVSLIHLYLILLYIQKLSDVVAQWWNVGLWLANCPCCTLDPQLMGEHLCG